MTAVAHGTPDANWVFAATRRDHVKLPNSPTASPTTTARTRTGIRLQRFMSSSASSDSCAHPPNDGRSVAAESNHASGASTQ